MQAKLDRSIALFVAVFVTLLAAAQAPQATPPEWKPVQDAMGRAGSVQPGDVFKFGMPRQDLHVTVRGVEVKPALALGSWVAFKKTGATAMLMGDLVLTDSEIEPVMRKLEQGGVEIMAIHNHLLWEAPRVMYMHIGGRGDAAQLARTIHDALALTKMAPPGSASNPQEPGLDTKQVEQALGHTGKLNGGVFQVTVPRTEKIVDNGVEVPPAMGVATGMNFQA